MYFCIRCLFYYLISIFRVVDCAVPLSQQRLIKNIIYISLFYSMLVIRLFGGFANDIDYFHASRSCLYISRWIPNLSTRD